MSVFSTPWLPCANSITLPKLRCPSKKDCLKKTCSISWVRACHMQRLVQTQTIWAQGSCCHLYTRYKTTIHRCFALVQVTHRSWKRKRKWDSPVDSQSGAGREFSRDPSVRGGTSQTYLKFNSPEDLPNSSPSFPCALPLSFLSVLLFFPLYHFIFLSLPCPASFLLSLYSFSLIPLQSPAYKMTHSSVLWSKFPVFLSSVIMRWCLCSVTT